MANEFSKSHCVSALAMTEDGDKPFFPLSPNVNFIHVTHCYQNSKAVSIRLLDFFKEQS